MLNEQSKGNAIDQAAFEAAVSKAVHDVVQQQVKAGLDVINDGEQSKPSFSTYVLQRISGFEDAEFRPRTRSADMQVFQQWSQDMVPALIPFGTRPIAWKDFVPVERDIANLTV